MGRPNKELEHYYNDILKMVENKDFSDILDECDKHNMSIDEIYIIYKNWLRDKKLNDLLND